MPYANDNRLFFFCHVLMIIGLFVFVFLLYANNIRALFLIGEEREENIRALFLIGESGLFFSLEKNEKKYFFLYSSIFLNNIRALFLIGEEKKECFF